MQIASRPAGWGNETKSGGTAGRIDGTGCHAGPIAGVGLRVPPEVPPGAAAGAAPGVRFSP
jgi:hypothetical protein